MCSVGTLFSGMEILFSIEYKKWEVIIKCAVESNYIFVAQILYRSWNFLFAYYLHITKSLKKIFFCTYFSIRFLYVKYIKLNLSLILFFNKLNWIFRIYINKFSILFQTSKIRYICMIVWLSFKSFFLQNTLNAMYIKIKGGNSI